MKSEEVRFRIDRRKFLGRTGYASLGSIGLINMVTQLRLIQAAAASNTNIGDDYKAVVCIFLNGGCDMNNVLVPIGTHPQKTNYAEKRQQIHIQDSGTDTNGIPGAVPSGIYDVGTDLSPDNPGLGSEQYGMHTSMMNMSQMFNDGDLGIMANVGTLAEPTTKANYFDVTRPTQLFSHSNQVQEFMAGQSDSPFISGWGGRMADKLKSLNDESEVSMLVTVAGTNDFMVSPGGSVPQYSVTSTGAVSLAGFGTNYANAMNPDGSYKNTSQGRRLKAFEQIMNFSNAHLLEEGYNTVVRRARLNEALIGEATGVADSLQLAGSVNFDGNFANANTNLGNELKMIARLIAGRKCLGNKRQIFFCNLGGFDTHQNINGNLPGLLSQIDNAVGAFNQTMKDLAGADSDFEYKDVLGFQASDFNRTFTPNGAPGDAGAGSDHAWGTNAFFFGGAVKGKWLYGLPGNPNPTSPFPDQTVGGSGTQDTPNNNRGRWIPTTAWDQYCAILSRFLGVDTSGTPGERDVDDVLPNLTRFADPFDPAINIDFIDPLA